MSSNGSGRGHHHWLWLVGIVAVLAIAGGQKAHAAPLHLEHQPSGTVVVR